MKPIDEGRKISGKKSRRRNLKKRSTNSKESVDTDQEIKKQKLQVKFSSPKNKNKSKLYLFFRMVKMNMDQIIILNQVNVHPMNKIRPISNEKKVCFENFKILLNYHDFSGISKSSENDETVEDITDSKLIEKTEALMTNTVE